VDRAIESADIVIFGIDREEPILDAERLRAARGDHGKPLVVVDFNTFSSTAGVGEMPGIKLFELEAIDKAVTASVSAMCADAAFVEAYDIAEDWIDRAVSDSKSPECPSGKCSNEHRSFTQRSTVS